MSEHESIDRLNAAVRAAYYTHDEVKSLLAEEVYKRLALERQVAALTSRVKTLEKMNARGAAQIAADSIDIKVAADRDYDRQFACAQKRATA